MAEFSTGAELEISVSQSSLAEARDTIQSELGDMEVDVNAVVSGNQRQPRDPSSGQFMAIEGMEQRQVDTTQTLENLIQIENERWELDKYRNDYLEQLADSGMMGGGGGDDGGGIGSLFAGRAGAAGASAAAGAVSAGGLAAGGLVTAGVGLVGGIGHGLSDRQHADQQTSRGVGLENTGGSESLRERSMYDPEEREDTRTAEERNPFNELPELPSLSEQEWPELPSLRDQAWPQLPDFDQVIEWPDPPDLNPFNDEQGNGGRQTVRGRFERQMLGTDTQRPGGGGQPVEPQIDLGGITVDITTTIEDAVDDAVDNVQSIVDREMNDLERRIENAIGFNL